MMVSLNSEPSMLARRMSAFFQANDFQGERLRPCPSWKVGSREAPCPPEDRRVVGSQRDV